MRLPALALLGFACSALLGSACSGKKADEEEPPPMRGNAAPSPMRGDASPRPIVPDKIEGTLALDGRPLEILRCRPGHEGTVYVDLVTAAGALRFVSGETERMFWNPRPEANERGTPIACSIPHRSWGGTRRPEDGTTYFRGELAFSCRGSAGAIEGKVSLECGNISPFERALLDDGRRRRRAGSQAEPR